LIVFLISVINVHKNIIIKIMIFIHIQC